MPTHGRYTDVYYKIIIPLPVNDNKMYVAALQEFDEYDYDSSQWLHDDDGVVSFDSEGDAQQYLADHVAEQWITPKDRKPRNHINNWRATHEEQ